MKLMIQSGGGGGGGGGGGVATGDMTSTVSCAYTCTCTAQLMTPGIGRNTSCALGDLHLGLCVIYVWLFAAKGVVVH